MNRYKRHLKSNIGKNNAWPKLKKTLQTLDFLSIDKANSILNWDDVPTVTL